MLDPKLHTSLRQNFVIQIQCRWCESTWRQKSHKQETNTYWI